MRILVVEDEIDLAQAIKQGLTSQGFSVDLAADGEEALTCTEVNSYDMIILDINLPKIDGLEVCRNIRSTGSNIGILMLTARSGFVDRVTGLDIGADDYLIKPFHFPELLARIRSIVRRGNVTRRVILKNRTLELNPNSLKAYNNGVEIPLTLKEFGLLEYMMRHAGRIISHEELLEHVWNEEANPFTQSVKVHVNNIRRKLEASGVHEFIESVKGRGYVVANDENEST